MKSLKDLRKIIGIAPSFVAKQLDITYRHFSRIENGKGFLTEGRADKLSELYGVSKKNIFDLYERSRDMEEKELIEILNKALKSIEKEGKL